MQIDEKHCPICGEENHCMAGTSDEGKCWCNNIKNPKEVLKLVPEEMKGKYCICQHCSTKV